MPDRKADDEILWFHAHRAVGSHRQDEIDGFPARAFQRHLGIAEAETVKGDDAAKRRRIEFPLIPQRVANACCLRIETDVPRKMDAARLADRLDRDLDRKE